MITVYTAVFGAYEQVRSPLFQDPNVRFVLVTDDDGLATPGWQVVRPTGVHGLSPRAAARMVKTAPWLHGFDVGGSERLVWVDGNVQFHDAAALEEAVSDADVTGFATFRHPTRSTVARECEACLRKPEYAAEPIAAQLAHYQTLGMPRDVPLLSTQVVARDLSVSGVARVSEAWCSEITRWSIRDQISLPFVSWSEQVPIAPFRIAVSEPRGLRDALALLAHKNATIERAAYALTRRPSVGARHKSVIEDRLVTNRWLTIHPHGAATSSSAEANQK